MPKSFKKKYLYRNNFPWDGTVPGDALISGKSPGIVSIVRNGTFLLAVPLDTEVLWILCAVKWYYTARNLCIVIGQLGPILHHKIEPSIPIPIM